MLYLQGPTGEYLQPARGEPSSNLLAMARAGPQMPLRLALRRRGERLPLGEPVAH